MKRCTSCGTEYDRAAWLDLLGRDWPELGLWLRQCPCGTTLSVPMVGCMRPRGEWHVLYMVEGRRTALPSCGATGRAVVRLAPEGELPSCARCLEDMEDHRNEPICAVCRRKLSWCRCPA